MILSFKNFCRAHESLDSSKQKCKINETKSKKLKNSQNFRKTAKDFSNA